MPNLAYITEALSAEFCSRLLETEAGLLVGEYEVTPWTREVKEVDSSFANGYPGILAVRSLIPLILGGAIGAAKDEARFVEVARGGFHLGAGICEYLLRCVPSVAISPMYRYVAYDGPSYDVYGGEAGTIITALIRGEERDASLLLDACMDVVLNRAIEIGFAHGRLGLLYALVFAADALGSETDVSRKIGRAVLKSDVRKISSNGLALCSSGISSLAVSAYASHVFGMDCDRRYYRNRIDMAVAQLDTSRKEDVPLHLCCGLSGLIDVILLLGTCLDDSTFSDLARDLAITYFEERTLKEIPSTGVLHGLAGVAYQLARTFPETIDGTVLPSLMFPMP